MDPIMEIAEKCNLNVIEDAAQSIGAEYKGRRAGSMGDLGIFSFFPSKNLGGYGDSEMVVTNNEGLYEKVKILRVHGSNPKYYHKIVGGNFRLDALQAAVLSVKLKNLDQWSQRRRENAEYYDHRFQSLGLAPDPVVRTPSAFYKNSGDRNYHIYNQYTIRTKKRDLLQKFLKENGIGTEIYYPLSLHEQECFKHLGYQRGDLVVSEDCTASVLSLPVYPELDDEKKNFITKKIFEFHKNE